MSTRKIIITDDLKNVLLKMDNKISSILLHGEVDETLLHLDKNINYIDLSHTTLGYLSYLNQDRINKIEADDNNYWNVKMRYYARPGSVIKKLFKLNDWEISEFTTQFLSIVDPPIFKMEIVKGEDIVKYYNHENYIDNRGSLGASCMKTCRSNYFDIYVQNPDTISMLVMLNQHDKVMGRAILWKGDDFNIMDRVYVSNDNHTNYFNKWAEENNYIRKEFNSWNTPTLVINNGEKEVKKLHVDLQISKFENYPYLDSFKWLDVNNKRLYNYIPYEIKDNLIVVSDYLGNFYNSNYFDFCELTNKLYSSSEIVVVEYLNNMKICTSELRYSRVLSKYILEKDSVYLEDIGDYIFNEEYDKYNDHSLIELQKKTEKEPVDEKKECYPFLEINV